MKRLSLLRVRKINDGQEDCHQVVFCGLIWLGEGEPDKLLRHLGTYVASTCVVDYPRVAIFYLLQAFVIDLRPFLLRDTLAIQNIYKKL